MTHPLIQPAVKISDALDSLSKQRLPNEVLVVDPATVAIVVDVEGVDYIMTMMRVPKQRERPSTN